MRCVRGFQNLVYGLLLVGTIGCGGKGSNAGDGSAGAGGTVAAGGGGGSVSCPAGTETCACYGNDTCNAGLSCFSHLCVRVPSDGGAGAGGTSGSGGASGANGSGGTAGVLDAGATICGEQQTCNVAGELCVAPCNGNKGTTRNSCVCVDVSSGSSLEYACGVVSCSVDASTTPSACAPAVAEGVSCTAGVDEPVCATPCVGKTRSECACTRLGLDAAKGGGQWLCATGVACN
jgi:hypothetical protein